MDQLLLPLFPLDVVLFPGMSLPLHIFEPRYKLMIGECLQKGEEFGVLLSKQGGIARVGCSAEILSVIKKYEDGRLDILTLGRQRFRVVELFEDLQYMQGQVQVLEEEEGQRYDHTTRDQVYSLYQEILGLLAGRQPPPPEDAIEQLPSFRVVSVLPLELEFKQQVLELDSEGERLERLLEYLPQWLRQLERLQTLKRRAAGNGHGR